MFDIRRDPNLHTLHSAFGGGGPHFCLGANLARVEMKRRSSTSCCGAFPTWNWPANRRRLRSNFINGIKNMPVKFTPTK